jgi:hypothetical protein
MTATTAFLRIAPHILEKLLTPPAALLMLIVGCRSCGGEFLFQVDIFDRNKTKTVKF